VNWTTWHNAGGDTSSAPALAASSSLLYQSVRGLDNNIYTRSSTNGVNWTSWQQSGGQTPNAPAIAVLNGLLYQSHRGFDNNIYTRSSSNGVNWTGWHNAGGQTYSAPALAAVNGRLYQAVRGTDNNIYTRSSSNGVNWTGWHNAGGQTSNAPSLEAVNGRLYQSVRGLDNKIYTRSSTDGMNWTGWHNAGGDTPDAPSLGSLNGWLYQSHQGLDNKIYTRSSTNGVSWTGWHEAGGTVPTEIDVQPDYAGNSTGTARNLGTLSSTQSFEDFVGSADKDDFYRFSIANTSNFNLSLSGLSGDADVKLLNSSGGEITRSTQGGFRSESISRELSPGTYFVQVYAYSVQNTNYKLSMKAEVNPQQFVPFVSQLYRDILNREPDSGGLQSWTNAMASGMTSSQARSGIANSQESRNNINVA